MIIMDRKLKRKHNDADFSDPFSLKEIHKEKARTIDVPRGSDNPIYSFLERWGSASLLVGKTVYCMNDRKQMVSGKIVDVYPPDMIHIKGKGVFYFKNVIAMKD